MIFDKRLFNQSKNTMLVNHLSIAESFVSRTRGLLGIESLPEHHGLWIHTCPSIHTFFMKFEIDAVFVDEKLIVRSIHRNIRPWRVVVGALGSSSVFEMPGGSAKQGLIDMGDQLHVDH